MEPTVSIVRVPTPAPSRDSVLASGNPVALDLATAYRAQWLGSHG